MSPPEESPLVDWDLKNREPAAAIAKAVALFSDRLHCLPMFERYSDPRGKIICPRSNLVQTITTRQLIPSCAFVEIAARW